jgi:hypothetical protein
LRKPAIVWAGAAILSLVSCEGVPFGKVGFGELETHGTVDVDYLEAQMAPLEPRFQACYAQALRHDHSTKGTIRLSMRGGQGKLIPSVMEDDTKDASLSRCITDAIAGLSLVQREGTPPWAFTADWSVKFEILKRTLKQ